TRQEKPSLRQSPRVTSGYSSCSGPGRMPAPDRLWPPHVLAFSMTATGTSPSFSSVSSSSARSWSSRLAHASPAVPPPTIATPTSISSSGSSSPRLMNSPVGSTGGGDAAGETLPLPLPLSPAIASDLLGPRLDAALGLDRLRELGHDLVQVADDPEIGELEDRRV